MKAVFGAAAIVDPLEPMLQIAQSWIERLPHARGEIETTVENNICSRKAIRNDVIAASD